MIILEPDARGEFQQFFHLFDDETNALTSAASAILHSRFDLTRREVFEVPADFDDLSDLCQYPFDSSPADDTGRSRIFAKLRQFRGDINPKDPIRLFDRIRIYFLKKNQVRKYGEIHCPPDRGGHIFEMPPIQAPVMTAGITPPGKQEEHYGD